MCEKKSSMREAKQKMTKGPSFLSESISSRQKFFVLCRLLPKAKFLVVSVALSRALLDLQL